MTMAEAMPKAMEMTRTAMLVLRPMARKKPFSLLHLCFVAIATASSHEVINETSLPVRYLDHSLWDTL